MIRNKKAQVGQTISTGVILLLVFVLMIIFLIITGFIRFTWGERDQDFFVDSDFFVSRDEVFLEIFLNDFVLFDGKKTRILKVIEEMALSEDENLANLLKRKFGIDYSCEGKNFLQIRKEDREISVSRSQVGLNSVKVDVYLDSRREFEEIKEFSEKEFARNKEFAPEKDSFEKEIFLFDKNGEIVRDNIIVVFAKENVKCGVASEEDVNANSKITEQNSEEESDATPETAEQDSEEMTGGSESG